MANTSILTQLASTQPESEDVLKVGELVVINEDRLSRHLREDIRGLLNEPPYTLVGTNDYQGENMRTGLITKNGHPPVEVNLTHLSRYVTPGSN